MAFVLGEFSDVWGFIPTFLSESDPRSTIEQLDHHYVGKWNKFDGFTLDKDTLTLTYPDDPPMQPIDKHTFRNDTIAIYPYSWVLVMNNETGEWEVARMD